MASMRSALRVSSLLLAVLVASCDTAPPTQVIGAPHDVLTSKSAGLVRAQAVSGTARGAAENVIGSLGGKVTAGGHSLTVPADAVAGNTTFSITALDGEYIEVYLSAIQNAGHPHAVNVGAQGFANGKTVTLTLSYAHAAEMPDPSKLLIVRYLADGGTQELPVTVDTANMTVSADLGHFSKYAMATW
jgi:hypothetical protein